ncbi:MAG: hypothetical protein M3044_17540 [Thermoproteota archaeon]|nr:hypothetical protein [Thermoproteota archaeon]
MAAIKIPRFLWTKEKLIDELLLHLVCVTEIVIDEEGKNIAVKKYYRRAKELERWIPIARPPPEYLIDMSDLNDRLRKELLDEITSNDARQDVIKEAVGRIFENLNLERYHLSIARNLKVRLV